MNDLMDRPATPRRRGFPIFSAMVFVLLAALALAAVRLGSFDCLRAIYAATIVLLLSAVVLARYRTGPTGGFWFGFAVFGWGYVLIAVAPWTWWGYYPVSRGTWTYVEPLGNPLLWSKELVEGVAGLWKDAHRPVDPGDLSSVEARREYIAALSDHALRVQHITGIVHMLLAWLVGTVGGAFGWWMAGGRLRPSTEDQAR